MAPVAAAPVALTVALTAAVDALEAAFGSGYAGGDLEALAHSVTGNWLLVAKLRSIPKVRRLLRMYTLL